MAPTLKTYLANQGSVTADNLNAFVQTCPIFANLRDLVGVNGMLVLVQGQLSPNDGLGTTFYWNSTSTATDNNLTVIAPFGNTYGRWLQLVTQGGGGGGGISGPSSSIDGDLVIWSGASGKIVADSGILATNLATIDTANTFAQPQTFSAAPIISPLTGYLKGNGASALTALSTVPTSDLSGTLQATQFPALTGDVSTTAGSLSTTIGVNVVTYAKSAQAPATTFSGNPTGSTANKQDMTAATAASILPAFVGDSGSGGVKGSVPAPASGDAAASKFLSAAGTWGIPAGSGSGNVSGTGTSVVGNLPSFNNTTATAIVDSGIAATNVGTLSGTQTFSGTKTFTTANINGGAINATPIGQTTRALGAFSQISTGFSGTPPTDAYFFNSSTTSVDIRLGNSNGHVDIATDGLALFIVNNSTGDLAFQTSTTGSSVFYSSGVEKGRFTPTGLNNAPIGQTTPQLGTFTNLAYTGTFTGVANTIAGADLVTNSVTGTQLSQGGATTFFGNSTGSTANKADISTTTAASILPAFVGDSGSGGTKGSVPAPASGDAAAGKFLSASGAWSLPLTLANLTTLINSLPTTLPGTTGVLWLNGGLLSVS